MTRFITVGILYNFNHFDFTKAFGASDIHSGSGFHVSQAEPDD